VSESLRQKAIELGVVDSDRAIVLAAGSCAGVDPKRFALTAEVRKRTNHIRHELGVPPEAPVIGFVGRLTRDKGIQELVEAFLALKADFPELRLILVGEMEEGDPLPPQTCHDIECEPRIRRTGFVKDPADYYHVMDVLALPTYREGFPTVVLEAHAAGKPVVASRATGVVDAVIDGVTGILVPIGDASALASALSLVVANRNLAKALGSAGHERVLSKFRQDMIWDALAQEYSQRLQARGLTTRTGAKRNEATPGSTGPPVVFR